MYIWNMIKTKYGTFIFAFVVFTMWLFFHHVLMVSVPNRTTYERRFNINYTSAEKLNNKDKEMLKTYLEKQGVWKEAGVQSYRMYTNFSKYFKLGPKQNNMIHQTVAPTIKPESESVDSGSPTSNADETRTLLKLENQTFQTPLYDVSQQYLPKMKDGAAVPLVSVMIAGIKKGGTATITSHLSRGAKKIICVVQKGFLTEFTSSMEPAEHIQNACRNGNFPERLVVHRENQCFSKRRCIQNAYKYNPAMKLLFMVRDPVQRLISEYTQLYNHSVRVGADFLEFQDWYGGNISRFAVNLSQYVNYFKIWLEFFPRDQIHLVDSAEFVLSPWTAFEKIESFLGIPHVFTQDRFIPAPRREFYCLRTNVNVRCMGTTKGRKHEDVSQTMLKQLYEYFKPYNEKFFKLVNQTFDWHMCRECYQGYVYNKS